MALVVAILALRFVVLPRVDVWRGQIEQSASQALGARVSIGRIDADLRRLNPRLTLQDVHVYEDGNTPVLDVPQLTAVIAWRSLVVLSPRLLDLSVRGVTLSLRRDATNHLWVAGQSIDLNQTSDHGGSPALRWLMQQGQISLLGTTLNYEDQTGGQDRSVALHNVNVTLDNGVLSHRFAVQAQLPEAMAGQIDIRGHIDPHFLEVQAQPDQWSGELYVSVQNFQPQAWGSWLPDLANTASGSFSTQAWMTLDKGRLNTVTVNAAANHASWHQGQNLVQAASVNLHAQGAPGDLFARAERPAWLNRSQGGNGLRVQAQASGLSAAVPEIFASTQVLDTAQVQVNMARDDRQGLQVRVTQADLHNPDGEAHLQGVWSSVGRSQAGTVDFTGQLNHVPVPRIYTYLPLVVSAEARDWMAQGLQSGIIGPSTLVLKGDLSEFPFDRPGAQGEFRIAGQFSGTDIDYASHEPGRKPWPILHQIGGTYAVDRASLTLDGPSGAYMQDAQGEQVALTNLHASIPNMGVDPTLSVTGQADASVPKFLALSRQSRLDDLLDHLLTQAQGSGDWLLNLNLVVPLHHVEDAQVQGRIHLQGSTFNLGSGVPTFTAMQGELPFTQHGVLLDQDISGQFLGGPITFLSGGGIGGKGTPILKVRGQAQAASLVALAPAGLRSYLTGTSPYTAEVSYHGPGSLNLQVHSTLQGMALTLPAPLGKTAAASVPVDVAWTPSAQAGRRQLRVQIQGLGQGVFETGSAQQGQADTFVRGSASLNRPLGAPPTTGVAVAATLPSVNVDQWLALVNAMTGPATTSSSQCVSRPDSCGLLLRQLDVQAGTLVAAGHTLQNIHVQASRDPGAWNLSVQSKALQGTAALTLGSDGAITRVQANIDALDLGSSDADEDKPKTTSPASASTSAQAGSSEDPDQFANVPQVELNVKNLSWKGMALGTLALSGSRTPGSDHWTLSQFALTSPAADLKGAGQWTLAGPDRGLSATMDLTIRNLGNALKQMGMPDEVANGKGVIHTELTWKNFPQDSHIADLSGQIQFSLDDGRFVRIDSQAGKILELLSLQSLNRLAKLQFKPGDLLREGFPFDTIRGTIKVDAGKASADGLKINGPVATIVLAGNSDLVARTWDMRAVVIPNLDVSGAAVLTGLAVNPLIGLSAFVGQWLLKQPLSKWMTTEYAVTGNWDDPVIQQSGSNPSGKSGQSVGIRHSANPTAAAKSSSSVWPDPGLVAPGNSQ